VDGWGRAEIKTMSLLPDYNVHWELRGKSQRHLCREESDKLSSIAMFEPLKVVLIELDRIKD